MENEKDMGRWIAAIKEIGEDNLSGASELSQRAARTLMDYIHALSHQKTEELLRELSRIGRMLIQTQPSMAPIFRLVNDLLLHAECFNKPERVQKEALEWLKGWERGQRENMERICLLTSGLIHEDDLIVTYSYSSSVLKALCFAAKKRIPFRVILSEGRPMNEGVRFADALSREGIGTSLVVDNVLFSFIDKADIILIGADALSEDGLLNKAGTFGLAVIAKELGKAFYTLCGTDKFLPIDWAKKAVIDSKPPDEVLAKPPQGVEVMNIYFDKTPLEYLTAAITEKGMMNVEGVRAFLRGLSVSNWLE